MGENGSIECYVKLSGFCSEYCRQYLIVLQKQDINSFILGWLFFLLCGKELQVEKERGDIEQDGVFIIRNFRKGNRKGEDFKVYYD